jgi:histone deacetylase 6
MQLMEFAGGKIVLALEGGYNLKSLADSFLACVEALLKDGSSRSSVITHPFESTWCVIQAVIYYLNISVTRFLYNFCTEN